MGGKGKHPDKKLTALRVKALKTPGRYADGGGLYLLVKPSGAKSWVLRVVVHGRRRDIGLGGADIVNLADARELARQHRTLAGKGGDPIAERRKSSTVPTFEEAARKVHAGHGKGWRNPKHKAQWINTVRDYAFPEIGKKRVDQIGVPEVLKVLAPIWLTKPETARRVRQRIKTVLDWAQGAHPHDSENPIGPVLTRALPRQTGRTGHHAALPYASVPEFITSLRDGGASEITKLAFEFLILTATRTGEVLGARETEIDLDAKVWTIPATRMKAEREFWVPLSARALEIVERALELSNDSEFVFAGRAPGKPLSTMTFLMLLRRMGVAATAHGFRSCFRDWAAEATGFPSEVCEMALAHAIGNRTEASYRRGDLFEKRRQLMNAWASFVDGGAGKVVPLRQQGGRP